MVVQEHQSRQIQVGLPETVEPEHFALGESFGSRCVSRPCEPSIPRVVSLHPENQVLAIVLVGPVRWEISISLEKHVVLEVESALVLLETSERLEKPVASEVESVLVLLETSVRPEKPVTLEVESALVSLEISVRLQKLGVSEVGLTLVSLEIPVHLEMPVILTIEWALVLSDTPIRLPKLGALQVESVADSCHLVLALQRSLQTHSPLKFDVKATLLAQQPSSSGPYKQALVVAPHLNRPTDSNLMLDRKMVSWMAMIGPAGESIPQPRPPMRNN